MTPGFKLHHCAAAALLALAPSVNWAQPSGHIMVDPDNWHPVVERVTVLSGNFNMGSGETFDPAKSHALNAGGMTIMPADDPRAK